MVKFSKMDLEGFVVKSLREMGIEKPTEVQDKLIPRIL